MSEQFYRTSMLIGDGSVQKLLSSRIAVFGAGGVGCAVIEALARAGVGAIDVIDNDVYSISNLNRQLYATADTIGRSKAAVAVERVVSINPNCSAAAHNMFYLPENADSLDLSIFDYIIDAIDTVSAKIELAIRAQAQNVPIISCMGTGNKLDATAFEVADIYKTSVCPLARVMRTELKKRGIKKYKVVYSKEKPIVPLKKAQSDSPSRRDVPGSVPFVPSVAGYIIAGEVIKDLIK